MRENEVEVAEQNLDRLANLALYHQAAWLLMLVTLLVVNPSNLKELGRGLAVSALVASFIASRVYIYAGKKVEELKKFSEHEMIDRKREYASRFFSPYFLWAGCLMIFNL